MTSRFAPALHDRGKAAFAVCEAAALATRTRALLVELSIRLDAFACDGEATRTLSAHALAEIASLSDDVAELTGQIAQIVDGLPHAPLSAAEPEIAAAARSALAAGIADDDRALAAAGLLTAGEGFPALAEALVCADAHAYWTARVVDVLAAFRGVGDAQAREVAARAEVPAAARFCELRPERVVALSRLLLSSPPGS